jgi:hypothetical protein
MRKPVMVARRQGIFGIDDSTVRLRHLPGLALEKIGDIENAEKCYPDADRISSK